MVEKKLLSCTFLPDVLCSFRKSEKVRIMSRCSDCAHYKRFMREMDSEDEAVMTEIDRIRKYGYPKKFDVPKE